MILPFKKRFVEPIMDGSKIHTIRRDSNNRWYRGRKVHFCPYRDSGFEWFEGKIIHWTPFRYEVFS